MPVAADDLWNMALGGAPLDAHSLASAIERQADGTSLDYRTRLLIRDSLNALKTHWGAERTQSWFASRAAAVNFRRIIGDIHDEVGFPSLSRRIMDAVNPQTILQFFRELSLHVASPVQLTVGGAAALILDAKLWRRTEDIDAVDEIPPDIRRQHDLLEQLSRRYGLHLTHFQSHYLPSGWQSRARRLDAFGHLDVWLVDVHDIFLGKLFSVREKDRDDLRALAPQLDKAVIMSQLRDTTVSLRSEHALLKAARDNWYILFGESLPG